MTELFPIYSWKQSSIGAMISIKLFLQTNWSMLNANLKESLGGNEKKKRVPHIP